MPELAGRGTAEPKRRATAAVNERLRPIRERRDELITDLGPLRLVLLDGNAGTDPTDARHAAQRSDAPPMLTVRLP